MINVPTTNNKLGRPRTPKTCTKNRGRQHRTCLTKSQTKGQNTKDQKPKDQDGMEYRTQKSSP